MKLNVDTNKIKTAGEDIKTIARDYIDIVNDVYNKIQNMSNNAVWISESSDGAANKFISATLKDRPSAIALGKEMLDVGNKISNYATDLNAISDNKL